MRRYQPILLNELLPELSREILEALDSPEYAPVGADFEAIRAQVPALRVYSLCSCYDDFCGSFHVAASRSERMPADAGPDGTIVLNGDLNIDLVGGSIVYVEVLFRPEIRNVMYRHFGRDPDAASPQ